MRAAVGRGSFNQMLSAHRNRAIAGLGSWFVLVLVFVGLLVTGHDHQLSGNHPGRLRGFIILGTFLLQIPFFFWGCRHLAQGKGYSESLAFLGIFGPPVQFLVVTALLALDDKNPTRSARLRQSRHKRRSYDHSPLGRVMRCRRNALVGILFGLLAIIAGVVLEVFIGASALEFTTQRVVGIFVFVAGYAGVITGCWWWLKAKSLSEELVLIGLLPLGVFCIPFVRLIFFASPTLLALSMIMMALILLVVVLVLPDKSGVQRQRRRRGGAFSWGDAGDRHHDGGG